MRISDLHEIVCGGAHGGGQAVVSTVAPTSSEQVPLPGLRVGGQVGWKDRNTVLMLSEFEGPSRVYQFTRADEFSPWQEPVPCFAPDDPWNEGYSWMRIGNGDIYLTQAPYRDQPLRTRVIRNDGTREDLGACYCDGIANDGTVVFARESNNWCVEIQWRGRGEITVLPHGYNRAVTWVSNGAVMVQHAATLALHLYTPARVFLPAETGLAQGWPGPMIVEPHGAAWAWYERQDATVLHRIGQPGVGYKWTGNQFDKIAFFDADRRVVLTWAHGAGEGLGAITRASAFVLGDGTVDLSDRFQVPDIPPYGRAVWVGPEYASDEILGYAADFPANCEIIWRDIDWAKRARPDLPVFCDEIQWDQASGATLAAVVPHLAGREYDQWPDRLAKCRLIARARRVPLWAYVDAFELTLDPTVLALVDGVIVQCYPRIGESLEDAKARIFPVLTNPKSVGALSAAYTGSNKWDLQLTLDLWAWVASVVRETPHLRGHWYWPWLSNPGRGHQAEHPEFRVLAERTVEASAGTPDLPIVEKPAPEPPAADQIPRAKALKEDSMIVALRHSNKNDYYVCLPPADVNSTVEYRSQKLDPNWTLGGWEKAELLLDGDECVAHYIDANEELSMDPDGNLGRKPAGTYGAWEKFKVAEQPDGRILLTRWENGILIGAFTAEEL